MEGAYLPFPCIPDFTTLHPPKILVSIQAKVLGKQQWAMGRANLLGFE